MRLHWKDLEFESKEKKRIEKCVIVHFNSILMGKEKYTIHKSYSSFRKVVNSLRVKNGICFEN